MKVKQVQVNLMYFSKKPVSTVNVKGTWDNWKYPTPFTR